MELNFNWINLLVLFGAVQGLIFCIILLFNKKHPGAKFLSAFMFVLAYNGFETFNWSVGLDKYHIFFDLFSFISIFALGPSLYFYTNSLLHPEKKWERKKILAHYGIVIFQFIYRFIIVILYYLWKFFDIKIEFTKVLIPFLWIYAEPLSVAVFIGYLVASLLEFKKHENNLTSYKSTTKENQQLVIKWIRALLICMSILGILWPLTVLSPYFLDIPFDVHYYPIELALVLFIYWIAFVGYYQTKTIYPLPIKSASNQIAASDAEQFWAQLQHAMEHDRIYLDPELNLEKMANHTGISPKNISAVLNQHFQKSFSDFVNEYRIKEVIARLLSAENNHLTISGMALESGFNSQATFQRVFKNIMGMSPRQYLSEQVKSAK